MSITAPRRPRDHYMIPICEVMTYDTKGRPYRKEDISCTTSDAEGRDSGRSDQHLRSNCHNSSLSPRSVARAPGRLGRLPSRI